MLTTFESFMTNKKDASKFKESYHQFTRKLDFHKRQSSKIFTSVVLEYLKQYPEVMTSHLKQTELVATNINLFQDLIIKNNTISAQFEDIFKNIQDVASSMTELKEMITQLESKSDTSS